MNENLIIDIYDDKGKLKNKADFLKEMEKAYDKCKPNNDNENFSFLDFITNPDNQVNLKNTYNTFNFLNRNFYLNEEITSELVDDFYQFVSFWNDIEIVDQTPVDEIIPLTLYINSPGGDLNAALSIISIINSSKIPINTHVYGNAWSGAFFIAINGKKRSAEQYSTFLFHEGSAGFEENAHKFIQFSDFYRGKLLEQVKYIVINKTKIDEAEYIRHKNDDWWLTAEDALSYGIIDTIGKEDIINEIKSSR